MSVGFDAAGDLTGRGRERGEGDHLGVRRTRPRGLAAPRQGTESDRSITASRSRKKSRLSGLSPGRHTHPARRSGEAGARQESSIRWAVASHSSAISPPRYHSRNSPGVPILKGNPSARGSPNQVLPIKRHQVVHLQFHRLRQYLRVGRVLDHPPPVRFSSVVRRRAGRKTSPGGRQPSRLSRFIGPGASARRGNRACTSAERYASWRRRPDSAAASASLSNDHPRKTPVAIPLEWTDRMPESPREVFPGASWLNAPSMPDLEALDS
jgi:hypothetical protein